jgi:tyrosine-protein kinase Etk/Wzc
LDRYIKLPSKGLTNYLSTKDDSVENYIVPVEGHDCLWVLPSGVIPPNPVELLMNPRVERLFTELKAKFDYIIVDTAPVSVVTDTLLIAKNADAFIYVMRANYLDKRLLKLADSFYREKKLPNMSIVLNDTLWGKPYGYGAFGYGYGYGYGTGYGYAADPVVEPWYKRIFKRS